MRLPGEVMDERFSYHELLQMVADSLMITKGDREIGSIILKGGTKWARECKKKNQL